MEDINNWDKVRTHFSKSFGSSLHVSIASVDSEGNPTTTPVGSLFLNKDQTGFYFEKYVTKLPVNSKTNSNICVLGVNSSKLLWITSLFKGKFSSYPAVKLYGQLGALRKATDSEIYALKKRMKSTKRLKGHKYLWDDMSHVREISFDRIEKINLGKMTADL